MLLVQSLWGRVLNMQQEYATTLKEAVDYMDVQEIHDAMMNYLYLHPL